MYTARGIVGYDGSAQADDELALGKLISGASGVGPSRNRSAVRPTVGGRDMHSQGIDAELTEKLEQAGQSVGAKAETITAGEGPGRGVLGALYRQRRYGVALERFWRHDHRRC